MVVLIFLLAMIGIVVFEITIVKRRKNEKYYSYDVVCNTRFALWSVTIVSLIVGIILLSVVINEGKIIEEKLAMYEQENEKIEQVVDTATREYLGYESKIYDEIGSKSDAVTTVAVMYPELASSDVVKEQIKLYEKNNEKIKQLKESKIGLRTCKWWLYFGK